MSAHTLVFLFSGQGSHYRGMGQKLYENNRVFRSSIEQSEMIIQHYLNRSLIQELYGTSDPKFDDLLLTHPSIIAVEIALYEALKAMGISPDYVSGSSLGEFSAGVACGVWDLKTALEVSIEQAKAIIRNCDQGGMLAVIDQEKKLTSESYLKHDLFLAMDNFEGHFTLSGSIDGVQAFALELEALGVGYAHLSVQFPFHSPLIHRGLHDFRYYMSTVSLHPPHSGFISSIANKELDVLPWNYFEDAVSGYSDYSKTVQYLETKGNCLYVDLGPSGTSSTFVRHNLAPTSSSIAMQIMTPFKRESKQIDTLKELLGIEEVV